jgi:hypothetical protein
MARVEVSSAREIQSIAKLTFTSRPGREKRALRRASTMQSTASSDFSFGEAIPALATRP